MLKGSSTRGLVAIEDEVVARDPFALRARRRRPRAHSRPSAQRDAHRSDSRAATPGDVFLLHGVTGSGKTLVYIELLRRVVLEQGKTAIVLVPEIALTPQTVDRFRAVFGDKIAVLHSALSDGERYDAWLALRDGRKRIAVGARSAIFAPLRDLGAIVVDEEHEASYKQGETPRYHAREVAIVRARNEGAVVVLGSATPSPRELGQRASGEVHAADAARARRRGAAAERRRDRSCASTRRDARPERIARRRRLAAARDQRGARGGARPTGSPKSEQSILLLNRRGYAAFVQCGECGDVATCPNCTISLTYHRTPERLVCHYCQHAEAQRTAVSALRAR